MGLKYPGNTISGYNTSPPPDDGTTGDDNKLTWAKHKDKLSDPVKALAEAINTDLATWADNTPTAKSGAYTTVAGDNNKIIQCTGSPTITLGAAATMGAGYKVTVKNTSTGTVTVDPSGSEEVDGSASNRTLAQNDSETYVVNAAGTAYMLKDNKGIGAAETVTLTNKTLTSPVINTSISGSAFLDEDDMSSDSATKVASQQSIKAYVTSTGGQTQSTDKSINPLADGANSVAHGLGAAPEVIDWYLECVDGTQTGFALGDRIFEMTGGGSTNGFTIQGDSTNINVNWNSSVFGTDDSGTTRVLTPAYWKFVGRASRWNN